MGADQCKYDDQAHEGEDIVKNAHKNRKKKKRKKHKEGGKTKGGSTGEKRKGDSTKPNPDEPEQTEKPKKKKTKQKDEAGAVKKLKDEADGTGETPSKDVKIFVDDLPRKEEDEDIHLVEGVIPGAPTKPVTAIVVKEIKDEKVSPRVFVDDLPQKEEDEDIHIIEGVIPGAPTKPVTAIAVKETKKREPHRAPTLPQRPNTTALSKRPDTKAFSQKRPNNTMPAIQPRENKSRGVQCIFCIPKCFALHYLCFLLCTIYLAAYFGFIFYFTDYYENDDVTFFTLEGQEHRESWKLIAIIVLGFFVASIWCLNMCIARLDTEPVWIAAVVCCYPLKWCCVPGFHRPSTTDLTSLEWRFWGLYIFFAIGGIWYSGDALYAIFDKLGKSGELVGFILQLTWWAWGGVVLCTYLMAYPLRFLTCPEDKNVKFGHNAIELTGKLY